MKPIVVDNQFLAPYFDGKKKYKNYYKSVDIYHHMSFHFDGYFQGAIDDGLLPDAESKSYFNNQRDTYTFNPYFTRLIDMRRPSESDAIKLYRRTIYLPFTQMQCFKVYNSLRKIVKSPDWKIDYSRSERPSGIADGEYLQDYCENKFPDWRSIENWVYSYAFRHVLVDPNALIVVLPESDMDDAKQKEANEFPEPAPMIIPSYSVLDFVQGEYAIFMLDNSYYYDSVYGEKRRKIMVITNQGAWLAVQKEAGADGSFLIYQVHEFPVEVFPVIQTGGIVKNYNKHCKLYQSFLSPMLAGLDAAMRESSDADAEVVQHIYSTMWYFSVQNCTNCMGSGKVLMKGKQTVCNSCEGNGTMAKSPYKDMVLKPGSFDQEKMPTPPAGYITKPTEMVDLMSKRIDNHIYYGLSAINMEYLASEPLSQSGKAKEVDRDELNNFVYGIAYHLVENVVNPVYKFVNDLRYGIRIPDEAKRDKMLPRIPVPEKFDLLTESVIEQQLASARTSKADPLLISQLETDLFNKRFSSDQEAKEKFALTKKLNPFDGYSVQELADIKLARMADPVDITVALYISEFVDQAIIEKGTLQKPFSSFPQLDQRKIMQEYAKQKIKDMAPAPVAPVKEEIII